MALPSTGSISMSQVRSELGLSGSISLGQSEVRALAGRSSGSISMSHLRGKSAINWNGSVSSLPSFLNDFQNTPNSAFLAIRFLSNGNIETQQSIFNGPVTVGRWDGSDQYTRGNSQVRFVPRFPSSSITNSASNWTLLGSNQYFEVQRNMSGSETIMVDVSLREAGKQETAITKRVTLDVVVDFIT